MIYSILCAFVEHVAEVLFSKILFRFHNFLDFYQVCKFHLIFISFQSIEHTRNCVIFFFLVVWELIYFWILQFKSTHFQYSFLVMDCLHCWIFFKVLIAVILLNCCLELICFMVKTILWYILFQSEPLIFSDLFSFFLIKDFLQNDIKLYLLSNEVDYVQFFLNSRFCSFQDISRCSFRFKEKAARHMR